MYIHTLQSTAMISCIYLTSVTYTGQGPARSEASPRTHTFGSVAGADCHLDACGVCVCVRIRARACMPVRACVRVCVCFVYVCEYMIDSYQTELTGTLCPGCGRRCARVHVCRRFAGYELLHA